MLNISTKSQYSKIQVGGAEESTIKNVWNNL